MFKLLCFATADKVISLEACKLTLAVFFFSGECLVKVTPDKGSETVTQMEISAKSSGRGKIAEVISDVFSCVLLFDYLFYKTYIKPSLCSQIRETATFVWSNS